MFDHDEAGRAGEVKVVSNLRRYLEGVEVRRAEWPGMWGYEGGYDVNDLLAERGPKEAKRRLEAMFNNAKVAASLPPDGGSNGSRPSGRRRLQAAVEHFPVPDPAVYLLGDLRINGVDRHRHMGDLEFRQFFSIGRQPNAV